MAYVYIGLIIIFLGILIGIAKMADSEDMETRE
jgi:hypothetical protein